MRRAIKVCFVIAFCLAVVFALPLSVSAEKFEPDTTTSLEYEFDDTNRVLIVNCVDETGSLLKKVRFHTKRGEELLASLSLYGYEIIGFESDQGLWETCKLSWSSVNYVECAFIKIWYHFRTDFSKDVMTATVTLRKAEDITVKTRHFLRSDIGIEHQKKWYDVVEVDKRVVSYGTYFTSSAKTFAGHSLMTGYPTQIDGMSLPNGYPEAITGSFFYTKIKNAYGISDITDWMEWTVVEDTLKEEYKEYTTYSEDTDGSMGYCKNRVLYLDLYYERMQYSITFSSNGGIEAPEAMTQYYGFDIIIPDNIPTREGYIFLGWNTSQTATKAKYFAGDTYPVTESIHFYAVWEKDDYEFSVSDLTIDRSEIFPSSIVSVSARADSWDSNDAYENIPVELYYDGTLLTTKQVSFAVYGVAYVTFQIDVGTVVGEHEIEIRINWTEIARESDQSNNCIGIAITVKNDAYAFGITPIENNAPYTEGMSVITGYLISNDSDRAVLPEMGTPVIFTVYYYDENGEQIVVHTKNWDGLAIPPGETNLVYFKWTVPQDLAGTEILCACTVNGEGILKEYHRDNNTATLTTTIADRVFSQTPNPFFTSKAPSDYTVQHVPVENVGSVSWTMWEYENGEFVLQKYGIRIADIDPEISPNSNCTSAVFDGGVWRMKSGYGITLFYAPAIVALNGYQMPDDRAFTDVQALYATFPEYGYSVDAGEYRDLVFVNGEWCFAENESSDQNGCVHYVPLWQSDGEYVVSVMLTELWTPVGRITTVRNSNVIVIDGSLYDDWYR